MYVYPKNHKSEVERELRMVPLNEAVIVLLRFRFQACGLSFAIIWRASSSLFCEASCSRFEMDNPRARTII